MWTLKLSDLAGRTSDCDICGKELEIGDRDWETHQRTVTGHTHAEQF